MKKNHYDLICDEIWYVRAPAEERIRRLMDSRGYTREKAEQIMQSQLSDEEYLRRTQAVIDNSAALRETEQQVIALLKERI